MRSRTIVTGDPDEQPDDHGRPRLTRDVLAGVVLLAGLLLVVVTTMFGPPETLSAAHDVAPSWVGLRAVEMAMNVALFVPLGIGVGLIARARWLWALVALSATIELIQLGLPERQTELIDVATNSTGALLGYLIGRRIRG